MEYHRTSEKYHAKSDDSSYSGKAGGRPEGDRAAAQRKELGRGGGGGAAYFFPPGFEDVDGDGSMEKQQQLEDFKCV